MSKILNIEEVFNVKFKNEYSCYDGIQVETDDETIQFLIGNGQQCCENWGTYLYSSEDLKEYIGAEYLGYDELCCDKVMNNLEKEEYVGSSEVSFLNIHTSKGTVDFAVYNSHNGYYSHATILKIIDKKTNTYKVNKEDYI